MKKTNILKAAIAILAGASLFTLVSCDNLNQLSENESEKAYLRVSLSDEARTVLPYSGVTEFTDFKLSYYDTDPDTGDAIWTALGTTYASYSAFEKAEIELPKEFIDSSKTFKLEAKKGTLEFSATNSRTVTYGENNITFKLAPVTLGTGKGGFNYTLDFSKAKNARNVVSAYVDLYKITGSSSQSYIDAWEFAGDEISGNKIVVAKDQLIVPEDDPEAEGEYPYAAGSYLIKVTLCADEDNKVPVIIWSDIIQIAENQVTTGSSEVSSLNDVYTISFNTNGGAAVDPVKATILTESYSLSIPTATKEGYLFVGWYEDSALTTPFAYTKGAITEDKALYAKYMSETNADGTYNATSSSLSSLLSRLAAAEEADAVGKTQSNPATVKVVGAYSTSVTNALNNNSAVYVNLDFSESSGVYKPGLAGLSNVVSYTLPTVHVYDSQTLDVANGYVIETYGVGNQSWYQLPVSSGYTYTINWVDSYSKNGYTNYPANLGDNYIYVKDANNTQKAYTDDSASITFAATEDAIYYLYVQFRNSGNKCAFRVWAQPTSSGSGE